MNRQTRTASILLLLGFALFARGEFSSAADPALTLRYDQPAGKWTEALPLGNGRMGAMVFGTSPSERLQLNEESLWAGEPEEAYPDNFKENLQVLQQLVLEGKIEEARALGLEKLTKSPTSFRSYEPLGDLWIDLEHAFYTFCCLW